jgi:hypothetical protein
LELCYDENGTTRLFPDSVFEHRPMENHIYAMNFILDKAFINHDVVFNINLDDFYAYNRFERQLQEVKKGYDIISSDFRTVIQRNQNNKHLKEFDFVDGKDAVVGNMTMSVKNVKESQSRNHNIVAHPAVCYTRGFWERNKYYDVNRVGDEDFVLWKKAVANNEKFFIVPEPLLYYRLSPSQISSKLKKN